MSQKTERNEKINEAKKGKKWKVEWKKTRKQSKNENAGLQKRMK